jgi:hypothetical protein
MFPDVSFYGRRLPWHSAALKTIGISLFGAMLAACGGLALRDEPADLVGNGRNLPLPVELGRRISAPRSSAEIEHLLSNYPTDWAERPWSTFAAKVAEGDQLREVANDAGVGIGLFKQGRLFDTYLWNIV